MDEKKHPHLAKANAERAQLQQQMRQRLVTYLVAAFGLVAGMAWNDAINSLISHVFPIARNSVIAKFIYAAIITAVVVLVTVYVVRLIGRDEGAKK